MCRATERAARAKHLTGVPSGVSEQIDVQDHAAPSGQRSGERIGILTFHRCINYGSYWQARSLVEGLRGMGHDAVLLDHRSEQARRAEWRCAFQPLLPDRSRRDELPQYGAKARKMIRAADALPSSAPFPLDRPEEAEDYAAIVVGSDEVWNMRHPWYGGCGAFYGDGLPARRLVSYAASFGNHDASEGLHPFWADKLRRFDAISVRDRNSREMLRAALGMEPELVLDPVLQFPVAREAVERGADAEAAGEPYIAVYGHSFPDWYARAVRRAADEAGLKLVSIGYRNDWADEQRIDAGPDEFARAIAGAEALATNFFHGCVFALLFERPFACVASSYRANKLRDLMEKVGAEERLVFEDRESEIAGLLAEPVGSAVGARIAELRGQSSAYLSRALG